jgi:hypothetical protein
MTEKNLEEVLQRLDAMEKRLRVAEDIEQIKQLTIRYMTGHTLNDGDLEAEGYADDATFVLGNAPMVGKETIHKWVKNHAEMVKAQGAPWKLKNVPTEGHFILHPVISIDGDKAKGSWMQYCLVAEPRTMQLLYFVQALYDIEYVRKDGRWQISYLRWMPRIEPRHPELDAEG